MWTFLTAWAPWFWLCLAALMITLEVLAPGMHFIWFGLAAGVVALLAFAGFSGFEWQLAAFALTSIAALYFGRGLSGRAPKADADAATLNERGSQYVGRIVTVAEPITLGRGKVKVGDTVWMAEGPDLPFGASVTVTAVRGTVLVVRPA